MLLTHILHPIPYLFNNSQTVAFSVLSNLWNVTYIPQTHHSCYPTDDMCLFRPFACWAEGEEEGKGLALQRLLIVIGKLIVDKTKVHFWYIHLNMSWYATFIWFCYWFFSGRHTKKFYLNLKSTWITAANFWHGWTWWIFVWSRVTGGIKFELMLDDVTAVGLNSTFLKIQVYAFIYWFSISHHWDLGNVWAKN